MDTDFIHGVIPPIVTPTDAHDRVKENVLRDIVDHVIAGGVHGILALGSNGEFFGLEREEQERAAAIVMAQSSARVPVYYGIGDITTRACRAAAIKAQALGADAISILHPMFLSPNDEEMYQHFKTIAEATDLPVLLYNNPDRMRCGLSLAVIERLSAIPNIVGIKESSGDMTFTAEIIRRTRERNFKVIAGRDILIHATLAYGGAGTVASSANVVPQLVVEIYDKFRAGDYRGALEAQFRLAPMRMAYGLASFPVVTKDYMRLLGFDVGEPVLPNIRSHADSMRQLQRHLDDLGASKLV